MPALWSGAMKTLLLLLFACATLQAAPLALYRNPVHGVDFPDPDVLAAPDGWYYAYGTQARRGEHWINIQMMRSRDLVRWDELGDALPVKPAWAHATQNFWAPCVVRRGDTYVLYFSAEKDAKDGMGIGVATARSPAGPFVPRELPLVAGASFENIDPFAFDDPKTGRKWLYWGSASKPIRVQELTPSGLSLMPGSKPTPVVVASESDYERLIEGPYLILQGAWYYLFYSGDNCCGEHAHYAVLAARASSPTGPFERMGPATGRPDSVVVGANARWTAPGHNALVRDRAGTVWILYHAMDAARHAAAPRGDNPRVLLLDRVSWAGGWPRVERGSPSVGERPAPATR